MKKVEYKVKPVTRYIITRYETDGVAAGCTTMGEFSTSQGATFVATALASHERQQGIDATLCSVPASFDELRQQVTAED